MDESILTVFRAPPAPPAPPVPEELRAWKFKMPIPESVLSPPPPKPALRRIPQRPPRAAPQTPLVPPVTPEGKQEEGLAPEEGRDSNVETPIDEWVEVKKERKEKKPKTEVKKSKRPKSFFKRGIVVE